MGYRCYAKPRGVPDGCPGEACLGKHYGYSFATLGEGAEDHVSARILLSAAPGLEDAYFGLGGSEHRTELDEATFAAWAWAYAAEAVLAGIGMGYSPDVAKWVDAVQRLAECPGPKEIYWC